jgi:hypothetical protein
MAQIVERIYTYVPAKCLQIGGEQWARKLALGNQWSRVRLGFLGAIQGTASYTASYLLFGLSNGQSGGATAVGGSAIGASLSGSLTNGAGAWTFQSNSGFPYYQSSASGKVFRRMQGFPGPFGPSLATETSASISTVNIPAALPQPGSNPTTNYVQRRAPIYFDITREVGGSASATVAVYGMGSPTTQLALDFRPDHFLEGLDNPGTPTIYGQTMTQLINTTIPISDMLGALDTMFIMWQRTAGRLEISALGCSISRPLAWEDGIGGAADIMSSYAVTGTALPSVLTQGSGFSAPGVFSGSYTNPQIFSGWSGTCGYPHDNFWNYATGTVVSGVTINSGTGWASNGVL